MIPIFTPFISIQHHTLSSSISKKKSKFSFILRSNIKAASFNEKSFNTLQKSLISFDDKEEKLNFKVKYRLGGIVKFKYNFLMLKSYFMSFSKMQLSALTLWVFTIIFRGLFLRFICVYDDWKIKKRKDLMDNTLRYCLYWFWRNFSKFNERF